MRLEDRFIIRIFRISLVVSIIGYSNRIRENVINVTRDENGITSMSIYDFLLNEDSLEL